MSGTTTKERFTSGEPVLLVWDDADYDSGAQVEVGQEKAPELTMMYTLGWFGLRTRTHVTLWTDRYEADGDWLLRGKLTIRRRDVRRLERINLPEV